ncbi:MAG: toprim domain-containing protein [Rikenellaceae bacterium]
MENIKEISIKGYLANRGVAPKSERGGAGFYLSPLRTENTPSFKVDYSKNLWYDFGIGEGGSIVDLVMKMESCILSEAFRRLEGQDLSSSRWSQPSAASVQTTHIPSTPKTEIISTDIIKNRHLIAYLEKRAINLDIAQKYCREVHYRQNGKQYFAIGFQSDGGGWELRNAYYKGGNSPKAPTTIDNGSDTCLLFEGFMDMLAYLTLKDVKEPPINIAVLNSVSNLKKLSDFLSRHRTIHCFLDNDEAGRKALTEVQKLCTEVIDQSPIYAGHKDMNDYLIAKKQQQAVKPKSRLRL